MEEYGIELKLVLDKFNQKMEEIKNKFKGIDNQKINVSANSAQLEYLKQKITELNALLDLNKKKPFMDSTEVLKTEAELERLNNQFNKLSANQDKINSKSNKTFNNIGKSINKATSKLKRFGLALFSIRSIYALVSRASSAYLSQDTELSSKLQAIWTGLGALLSPIIEKIANVFLKAVKYINVFIKALTGVDLLAKASTKSLNNTTKSAKSLSKTLAGFDELTNLDTTSDVSGSSSGLGSIYDDINLNEGIVDVIESIAKKVKKAVDKVREYWKQLKTEYKDNYEWYKKRFKVDYSDGIQFSDIIGTVGANLGTLGDAIIDGLLDLQDKIAPKFTTWFVGLFGVNIDEEEFRKVFKKVKSEAWNAVRGFFSGDNNLKLESYTYFRDIAINCISGLYDGFKEKVTKQAQWLKTYIVDPIVKNIKFFFGIHSPSTVMRDQVGQYLGQGLLEGVVNGIKNSSFVKKVQNAWNTFKSIFSNPTANVSVKFPTVNSVTTAWNNIKKKIQSFSVSVTIKTTAVVENLKKWLNTNFVDKVNKVLPSFMGKIPQFAQGTNYVPQDQLAMIHKGEAIIPKKFNSDEYFGGGNEETNSLLSELIDAVNNIDINPYTTIKDVGNTAVNYINNRNRQLGRSVIT